MKSLIAIFLAASVACAQNPFFRPGPMPHEDADLPAYSVPDDFSPPDFREDLASGDLAAAATKISTAIDSTSDPHTLLGLYGLASLFARMQADKAEDQTAKQSFLTATLHYASLGYALAKTDPEKYHLHRAHFSLDMADMHAQLGDLESALNKSLEILRDFQGIGTGKLRNALAVRELQRSSYLRLHLGHEHEEIIAFLDSFANHDIPAMGFAADMEKFRVRMHQGDREKINSTYQNLQSSYAGQDSIGHLPVEKTLSVLGQSLELLQSSDAKGSHHEHD